MSDSFSRRKALTYIVCTVIVVLGLPAGAFAVVAGSNVFITDSGTGHRAHVNSSGQLQVNTTGSSVKVSNTVRATEYPAKPVALGCEGGNTLPTASCQAAVPNGETFVAQSLSVSCERNVNTPVRMSVDGHTTKGGAFTMYPVPGPDGAYTGPTYTTASQLTGTEYLTGTITFHCDGVDPGSGPNSWDMHGIAQGYLYP
ncbi:MAG: hypothetical protein ACTHJM_07385 [Marmoricola sp.]